MSCNFQEADVELETNNLLQYSLDRTRKDPAQCIFLNSNSCLILCSLVRCTTHPANRSHIDTSPIRHTCHDWSKSSMFHTRTHCTLDPSILDCTRIRHRVHIYPCLNNSERLSNQLADHNPIHQTQRGICIHLSDDIRHVGD